MPRDAQRRPATLLRQVACSFAAAVQGPAGTLPPTPCPAHPRQAPPRAAPPRLDTAPSLFLAPPSETPRQEVGGEKGEAVACDCVTRLGLGWGGAARAASCSVPVGSAAAGQTPRAANSHRNLAPAITARMPANPKFNEDSANLTTEKKERKKRIVGVGSRRIYLLSLSLEFRRSPPPRHVHIRPRVGVRRPSLPPEVEVHGLASLRTRNNVVGGAGRSVTYKSARSAATIAVLRDPALPGLARPGRAELRDYSHSLPRAEFRIAATRPRGTRGHSRGDESLGMRPRQKPCLAFRPGSRCRCAPVPSGPVRTVYRSEQKPIRAPPLRHAPRLGRTSRLGAPAAPARRAAIASHRALRGPSLGPGAAASVRRARPLRGPRRASGLGRPTSASGAGPFSRRGPPVGSRGQPHSPGPQGHRGPRSGHLPTETTPEHARGGRGGAARGPWGRSGEVSPSKLSTSG